MSDTTVRTCDRSTCTAPATELTASDDGGLYELCSPHMLELSAPVATPEPTPVASGSSRRSASRLKALSLLLLAFAWRLLQLSLAMSVVTILAAVVQASWLAPRALTVTVVLLVATVSFAIAGCRLEDRSSRYA